MCFNKLFHYIGKYVTFITWKSSAVSFVLEQISLNLFGHVMTALLGAMVSPSVSIATANGMDCAFGADSWLLDIETCLQLVLFLFFDCR